MERLLERGARDFKFIDRTFNLRIDVASAILRFFSIACPGLSLHFEMVPDRLPDELEPSWRRSLHEHCSWRSASRAGIPRSGLIERRQDAERTEANLRFLADETHVHVHSDLIVGLPGEDLQTFARVRPTWRSGPRSSGGDLEAAARHTDQMHDETHAMVYRAEPPYEIVSTSTMSETEIDAMKRFARFWILVNSGNFIESAPLIWSTHASAFDGFYAFSEWLFADLGRTHHIQLHSHGAKLYLPRRDPRSRPRPWLAVARDVHRTRGRKTPGLKPHLPRGWRPAVAPRGQAGSRAKRVTPLCRLPPGSGASIRQDEVFPSSFGG